MKLKIVLTAQEKIKKIVPVIYWKASKGMAYCGSKRTKMYLRKGTLVFFLFH